MRYVKGHALQTRNRIIEKASYGLRESGANGVSVSELMKLAGLTHGGFYAHFESREALVIEAFAAAMDRTISQWQNLMEGAPVEERFNVIVAAYLTPRHRDDRAHGCVLPALGADLARSSQKARRTFARKVCEMIDVLARLVPEKSPKEARQIATGALATLMGSIVLARAVGDEKLSDDILEAGRQVLGGQSAKTTSKQAAVGVKRTNKSYAKRSDHD
jgi:TetR/AcrR family transcriptional regulator, transcriptional repressor for nem operon